MQQQLAGLLEAMPLRMHIKMLICCMSYRQMLTTKATLLAFLQAADTKRHLQPLDTALVHLLNQEAQSRKPPNTLRLLKWLMCK